MELKKLLLKDLSARLSYHVICSNGEEDLELVKIDIINEKVCLFSESFLEFDISKVKPYLRPMSSMTEEEIEELERFVFPADENFSSGVLEKDINEYLDFLLSHYLDFRELIPKGLALEAPKEMYKI